MSTVGPRQGAEVTCMDDAFVMLLPMMMVAIGACVGLALRNHQRHLGRMEELQQQNAARQLEDDLLSCDTHLLCAHMTAILERLNSIERRLDAMDGRLRAGGTAAVVAGPSEEMRHREDRREDQTRMHGG